MRAPIKFASAVILGLVISNAAYAYMDPNSGGLIFQLVTPILAVIASGIAFTRRQISRACLSLFRAARGLLGRIIRPSRRDVRGEDEAGDAPG